MKRFDRLTKYIQINEEASSGEWVIDEKNDGTPDHPIHMPYVAYSPVVHDFMTDVYAFVENNKDIELTRYREILEKNGLKWSMASMKQADVSQLDAECVLALIIGAMRADRFSEGTLKHFFDSGTMLTWLKRLKAIDKYRGTRV